jgi:hypothetical protein
LATSKADDIKPQAEIRVQGCTGVRISKRTASLLGSAGLLAAVAATGLWVWPGSTVSRDEAIQTALRAPGNGQLPLALVTGVKLVHRLDLPKLIDQDGSTDAKPWDRVWVVVVKADLIPATMPGGQPPTYTVEVIRDKRPAVVEVYFGSGPGNRPANWDQVLDLEWR